MKKIAALMALLMVAATLFAGGKKEQVVITSQADLANKRIGVQAGTTGEWWVEENVEGAKLSSFKSGIDAALDLKNGALDAVVIDLLPAKSIVSKNKDLMLVDATYEPEAYAIAVKKGNEALLKTINDTIESMKADGTYAALQAAYMPEDGNIVIPAPLALSGATTIKMGTNAAFPPFEYVEGKDIVGFDIWMAQYIAAKAGAKLEVVDMAFDSLIPALQSGTIDFIVAGMSVTEERQKNVDFSIPYYESEQAIIIRK
ncbi:MAG: transporter substrate-binding domain-containing protein [Treponemataceae bacterium]|nr:transporter substrate-binding domain-containing protein [Treponemataceae bacterium]